MLLDNILDFLPSASRFVQMNKLLHVGPKRKIQRRFPLALLICIILPAEIFTWIKSISHIVNKVSRNEFSSTVSCSVTVKWMPECVNTIPTISIWHYYILDREQPNNLLLYSLPWGDLLELNMHIDIYQTSPFYNVVIQEVKQKIVSRIKKEKVKWLTFYCLYIYYGH